MGIFCMLFPAVLFCYIRNCLFEIKFEKTINWLLNQLFVYCCGVTIINIIVIFIRMIVLHTAGDILAQLNHYSDFAVKYMLLSVVLACILPYIEKNILGNCLVKLNFNNSFTNYRVTDRTKIIIIWSYAIFMSMHNFVRMFDN